MSSRSRPRETQARRAGRVIVACCWWAFAAALIAPMLFFAWTMVRAGQGLGPW